MSELQKRSNDQESTKMQSRSIGYLSRFISKHIIIYSYIGTMGMRMVSFLIRGVGGFTPLPPGPLPPFAPREGGEITTPFNFKFRQ